MTAEPRGWESGERAPEHWFDNFPDWAPRLVAAFAPFNEHLVSDTAAGPFAAGVAAASALWWRCRHVVIVAMAAFLAFALPYAVFHLTHPADALSGTEDVRTLQDDASDVDEGWALMQDFASEFGCELPARQPRDDTLVVNCQLDPSRWWEW